MSSSYSSSAPISVEEGMRRNPIYYSQPGPGPNAAAYIPEPFPQQTYWTGQATGPAMPYLSSDQYTVNSINMGNYGHAGTAYPSDQFNYEIPDNVCLAPGTNYPAAPTYFPGHQTYPWRFSPKMGFYQPGSQLSWCPRQTWNGGPATTPTIPLGGDSNLPDSNYYYQSSSSALTDSSGEIANASDIANSNLKYHYPLGGSTQLVEKLEADPAAAATIDPNAQAGVFKFKSSVTTPAPSLPTVTLRPSSENQTKEQFSSGGDQVDLLSPGEQTNWAHREVRQNRYDAQKPATNIYMTPPDLPTEPYTPALWQTPYDSSRNVISVGLMSNPYTGELTEVFQDQMPGPTTNKGQMLESQLHYPNPKLIAMGGGFNHHKPPPRKTELPGYVFNPVSARGGSNPFGPQVYEPMVRREMTARNMREMYNNRDGDLPAEQSFAKEQPHGFVGLVPRIRFNPYVPPTQELEYGDYFPPMQDQPTDLTKREEYTFESFAYKDPALVYDRMQYPNQYLNGTDAIASIPITTEHTGPQRSDLVLTYVSPAYLSGGAHIIRTELQKEPNKDLVSETLPVRKSENGSAGLVVLDTTVRNTLKHDGTAVPVAAISSQWSEGPAMSDLQLRESLKHDGEALPSGSISAEWGAKGPSMSDLQLRESLKHDGQTLPVGAISSEWVEGPAMSDLQLRDSLKLASMENPFRIVAGPSINSSGYVQIDKNAAETDRSMTAPGGSVDGGRFEMHVGPNQTVSLNVRGKCEQAYVPSQSMVPAAAGDVATRVVAPLQRFPANVHVENAIRDVVPTVIPTISVIGTGLRTTKRIEQEPVPWQADVQDF